MGRNLPHMRDSPQAYYMPFIHFCKLLNLSDNAKICLNTPFVVQLPGRKQCNFFGVGLQGHSHCLADVFLAVRGQAADDIDSLAF